MDLADQCDATEIGAEA